MSPRSRTPTLRDIGVEGAMETQPRADGAVVDRRSRPLRDLRLSVTDRCNLRCTYCMPEKDYRWLNRCDILDFDEITNAVRAFARLGVDNIRLTGGEPLLRPALDELVGALRDIEGITDLAMTTNGVLLAPHAASLRAAGLNRITVSLDTLVPARFKVISQRDSHAKVLEGVAAAAETFDDLKLDTVLIRGFNDDEIVDIIEFSRGIGAEARFIEYMDVPGATEWTVTSVVSRREILERVVTRYGQVREVPSGSAPAARFQLADGHHFGIVSSTTQPFCASCDRGRLTADGIFFDCLYATTGLDLRTPLREGTTPAAFESLVRRHWTTRSSQGAVDRLGANRSAVPVSILRRDPHLEMHTRGG